MQKQEMGPTCLLLLRRSISVFTTILCYIEATPCITSEDSTTSEGSSCFSTHPQRPPAYNKLRYNYCVLVSSKKLVHSKYKTRYRI